MTDLLERLNPRSYSFRARERPILIISIPIALAVWTWTGDELGLAHWLLPMAFAAGIPYVLGEWAADRGRRLEKELWESWGGAPTTQLLRHRGGTLNLHTLARIHEGLKQLCPDLTMPTAEEEAADPVTADLAYGSYIDRLRVLVRDKSMVLKANIAYGFRRNLWAIRWWGVATCVCAGLSALVNAIVMGTTPQATSTLVSTVFLAFFLSFGVRGSWVRAAAHIYARRLLESVETAVPATG